jgi:hypothetical protein
MGVASCEGCPKCGTTLAEGPELHREISPHTWGTATHGTGDDGQPLTSTVCVACGRKKRDVEAEQAVKTAPEA